VSQHGRRWDRTHTLLLGHEQLRLGARLSQNGQLFETDRGQGPGRRVIKLFSGGVGLGEEVVADFTRDVTTVANLRHPHIVQVAEVGRLPDGTPFVVMERLAGRTLEEVLAEAGALPVADIIPILRAVASALSAAHAAGVAHGELRADNVFLAEVAGYPRGFAKLLDFGVAHLSAAARGPGRGQREWRPDAGADRLALVGLAHRLLTTGRVVDAASALALNHLLSQAAAGSSPGEGFESVSTLLDALEAAVIVTGPQPVAIPEPSPPEPASLTQQFFADGERQEAAHAGAVARAPQPSPDPGDDRIPRSRARVAAFGSFLLLSAAVMVWTLVSLSNTRGASEAAVVRPPSNVTAAPSASAVPSHAIETSTSGRAIVRRARLANVAHHRSPLRTEPPALAAVTPAPVPSPPAPPPASAPVPAPIAAPDSPITSAPAAPFDEDFTQPWEQTDGESVETAAPASAEPEAAESAPAP
jgi:hypothetical protein